MIKTTTTLTTSKTSALTSLATTLTINTGRPFVTDTVTISINKLIIHAIVVLVNKVWPPTTTLAITHATA